MSAVPYACWVCFIQCIYMHAYIYVHGDPAIHMKKTCLVGPDKLYISDRWTALFRTCTFSASVLVVK